ncbi:MAG: deoxyribonuclease IV [Fimbriimonadaceae bacterium]|nr:deoxyribonuclease IV [Fimbriimonadaceae bacterium]
MAARYIGAHMPTKGGLGGSVRNGVAIGCTAVQVFTSSPQQWKSKPITDEMVADLQAAREETGLDSPLVSHDSYLINLAAPDPAKRAMSEEALSRELSRCGQLGIPYVVSHMGAHMGEGVNAGLAKVAESAQRILANAPESVTLLMETTAGQGTCLNWRFEEIAQVLDLVHGHPRLGVCLDTCHIFAAGYELRTREGFEQTFNEFDQLVGLDRIKVVHVNDSQKPFASRRDRHAHLGEGEIGADAFHRLVHFAPFESVPLIIETPEADEHHKRNVQKLWDWVNQGPPLEQT